ncbi:MAG: hypothetical protein HUK24_03545 [Sphaerochaetaceae bacterium]|nr:hypothetical protein [Sphaerochaetaceae bacterium]
MDYSFLLRKYGDKKINVGVIGATKGYGYTILAQLTMTPICTLRAICSRHGEECKKVLLELGYDEKKICLCEDSASIKEAKSDDILVITDYTKMVEAGLDCVIECTGNTAVGSRAAIQAMDAGIDVYMVSKETDSICGPYLNNYAAKKDVVYALANGDQPRNLADLISWANILGLEIICAGKSSENDLIYDVHNGDLTYLEPTPSGNYPELAKYWVYKDRETIEKRNAILAQYIEPISADLCEMNLVSDISGLKPACDGLHYPVARISELANIFIPKEEGGILDKTGVVDVFLNLRATDEASFAGGEFVVVKCDNEIVSDLLRGKGHVVSSNGKYLCLYYPYHLLGVETPASLVLGSFLKAGTNPECRQVTIMVGKAKKDIPAGTILKVEGHHHEIEGVVPQLIERTQVPAKVLPFYVLNGSKVVRDIKAGSYIDSSNVEMDPNSSFPYELYTKGLEL